MALAMRERHAVVKEMSGRYSTVSKTDRMRVIDQVVDLTGYTREYAALLLRAYARGTVYGPEGILLKPSVTRRRRREKYYDESVHRVLKKIWAVWNSPDLVDTQLRYSAVA